MSKITIELDDYEVANLRSGLLFLIDVGGDTGDWLMQIMHKLPDNGHAPIKAPSEQRRALALKVGYPLLFP